MRNLSERRRFGVRVRVTVLGLCAFVAAGVVLHRAWRVQVIEAEELLSRAPRRDLGVLTIQPRRGSIYDRSGNELAVSLQADSVFADPRSLLRSGADPRYVARRLVALLGGNVEELSRRLGRSSRRFVWVRRHVTPRQAQAVRAARLPGVGLRKEARRYYPNRELAAHLLGFVDRDGKGIEGIELSFDDVLRGRPRRVEALRDARRRIVFSDALLHREPELGSDLYLTIDRRIQYIAERELQLAVRTFEARGGSVVVLDPRTGEILAMANAPRFNPNDRRGISPSSWRNRAVTDRFEPGSTVKPFTVAAALAAHVVRPGERIDTEGGVLQVGEDVIRDSHRHGVLSLTEVLAYSSNVAVAKLAQRLGKERLYRALRRFGFGRPTGIPLPGEAAGILRHYRKWYDLDAASIAFGQGMSVTTVQLALAMASLANGGKLLEPMLVRRVVRPDGSVARQGRPRLRRRVVDRGVARLLSDMLTTVTGPNGTAPQAAIEGFLVAGKTGTAQKADYVRGGYAKGKWIASFVGFVPAERPRIVVAVVVDEPVVAHAGGVVAAPVFRRIASATLQHLGVVPRRTMGRARPVAWRRSGSQGAPRGPGLALPPLKTRPGQMPDLRGRTAREALTALTELRLRPRLLGSGLVVGTRPAPGAPVHEGEQVVAWLRPELPREPFEPSGAKEAEKGAPLAMKAGEEQAP